MFPRIEVDKEEKKTVSESVTPKEASEKISIDQFSQVELRVAEVLVAERVEKSRKLLRLEVAIGEERRQILAGIAKSYQPEMLVGKKIVVVANLKPAKLMGMESNGMLLAASIPGEGEEENISVLTVDRDIASGARVR